MTKLSESKIIEIRTVWGENPNATLEQLAKQFNVGKSTIHRVIHHRDPTHGDTLPSKRRARGGKKREKTPLAIERENGKKCSLAMKREEERTDSLIAGAENHARAIMVQLDGLLREKLEWLDRVRRAREKLMEELEEKRLDAKRTYGLALRMNEDASNAMRGVESTLRDMARLTQSVTINVDARSQTVVVDVADLDRLAAERPGVVSRWLLGQIKRDCGGVCPICGQRVRDGGR